MIIDKSLQLASAQSFAAVGNTAKYSTNWIDLSTVGTQIYESAPYLIVRVGTAFTNGTSALFELISATAPATDVDGTSLGTPTIEASSGAILTAALTANTIVWALRLPEKIDRRYLGVKITVVGTMNAGTIDIDMTPHIPLAAV